MSSSSVFLVDGRKIWLTKGAAAAAFVANETKEAEAFDDDDARFFRLTGIQNTDELATILYAGQYTGQLAGRQDFLDEALLAACRLSNLDMSEDFVRMLLDAGANVSAQNGQAIRTAVQKKNYKLVRLLIARNIQQVFGLQVAAARGGDWKIAYYLLANFNSTQDSSLYGEEILRLCIEAKKWNFLIRFLDETDPAVLTQFIPFLRRSLLNSVDTNEYPLSKILILHCPVFVSSLDLETIKYIFKVSCENGLVDMFRLVRSVETLAPFVRPDFLTESCLPIALNRGYEHVVKFLLENGANINRVFETNSIDDAQVVSEQHWPVLATILKSEQLSAETAWMLASTAGVVGNLTALKQLVIYAQQQEEEGAVVSSALDMVLFESATSDNISGGNLAIVDFLLSIAHPYREETITQAMIGTLRNRRLDLFFRVFRHGGFDVHDDDNALVQTAVNTGNKDAAFALAQCYDRAEEDEILRQVLPEDWLAEYWTEMARYNVQSVANTLEENRFPFSPPLRFVARELEQDK